MKRNISEYLGTAYIIKAALRRKEKVYIYRTDESTEKGKWVWAVALNDICYQKISY